MSLVLLDRITTLAGLATTLFQTLHTTLRTIQTQQTPPAQSRALHDETLVVSDLLRALGASAQLQGLSVAWERSVVSLDNAISQCTELVQEIFQRIRQGEGGGRVGWPFSQGEMGEYVRRLGRYKNVFRMVLEATGGRNPRPLAERRRLGYLNDEMTPESSSRDMQGQRTRGEMQGSTDQEHMRPPQGASWGGSLGGRRLPLNDQDDSTGPEGLPNHLISSGSPVETRSRVLEWISPDNHSLRHQMISTARLEGTGTWFLNSKKYEDWVSGSDSNVLFCHGVAGSGRTFLTSLAIDDLLDMETEEKIGVVYYYFDYCDPKSQHVETVIRSLLKQLLSSLSFIPSELKSESRTLDTWAFVRYFISTTAYFDKVYVLLDALDECTPENLSATISLIRRLREVGVKVFCTGRPYVNNIKSLLNSPAEIAVENQEMDLILYISMRLNAEWRYGDKFKQVILDALARRPERFLMGKVMLDFILGHSNPRDAIDSLGELPSDIEGVYREIMKRIENSSRRDIAIRTLSWLVYAQRPLKMRELQEIMSVRSGDKELYHDLLMPPEQILQSCQGLIECEGESGIVRLSHFSVQQFLQTQYREGLLKQIEIAKICLTYLTFDIFSRPAPDEMSYGQRRRRYQFTDYAAQFWGHHVRGPGENNREVLSMIFKIFQNPSKLAAIRQLQLRETSTISALSMWNPLHMLAQHRLLQTYNLLSKSRRPIVVVSPFAKGPRFQLTTPIPASDIPDIDLGSTEAFDSNGNTPLLLAVENDDPQMVKTLLQGRANLETCNRYLNYNALHLASLKGLKDMVVTLSQKGALINSWFENEEMAGTALYIACKNGHVEVVKELLKRKADTEITTYGITALQIAVINGHTHVVVALLNEKADMRSRAPSGATVLHLAASNGHKDIVTILLAKGADPRERDNTGWTAAHRAAAEGHKDVVMVLLHADNDIEDQIGILVLLTSLCPDDHVFQKLLGDTLCREGNPQEAIVVYNLAVKLDPKNKAVTSIDEIDHGEVYCVGCKRRIRGIWHHCTVGDGFEICQECYNTPLGESHGFQIGHAMLAIPSEEYLYMAGLLEKEEEQEEEQEEGQEEEEKEVYHDATA